jgi:predicted dinucleotide-binding enzyme
MTTVGLIGAGHIGGTVAGLAVAAGYDVVLSNSRGPETLQELVTGLGPRARAATATEAAQAGDLVVVTVPFKAYREVPVAPLVGKPVIDTNNYYWQRDGNFEELDDGLTTSSELLQRHLAGAFVVKGFNNIYFKHLTSLARPAGAPDRSVLAIAGDTDSAKVAVTAFLDAIGFDTVDAGPLAEGWRFQTDQPAYGLPYYGGSDRSAGDAGQPVDADTMRDVLAAAVRTTA